MTKRTRLLIESRPLAAHRVVCEDGTELLGVRHVHITLRPGELALAQITIEAPVVDVETERAVFHKERPGRR